MAPAKYGHSGESNFVNSIQKEPDLLRQAHVGAAGQTQMAIKLDLPDSIDERRARILALIIGTEGMIVVKDVLQLDDDEARKVKRWAIAALVEAARTLGAPDRATAKAKRARS